MLRRLFDNDLYPTGLNFRHYDGYPNTDGACIVVPGRYWHRTTDQISEAIERYEWVLLVRVSDEEDLFDVGEVLHRNVRYWLQTPRYRYVGDDTTRYIGVGFPPHFNDLPADPPEKKTAVFLSAQNTHERRHECFAALEGVEGGLIGPTAGFTKGWGPELYATFMTQARVAPAPSGAVSPDSFRLWEALEAHAVPIADAVSPVDGATDYWESVCPGAPFPVLTDYKDLAGYVEDVLKDWPATANRCAAYWMRYKRQLALWLKDDLEELGAV